MRLNISHFKKLIENEYVNTKSILDGLGKPHVNDKYDYDTISEDLDINTSEREEVAGKIESMETRVGLEAEAEKRMAEILAAKHAIENGTYGVCVVCGKKIPIERLEINPISVSCAACYDSLDFSSKI